MKKIIALLFALSSSQYLLGQISWSTNSSPGNPNHFIGWDVTAGSPDLNFKHELTQPMRFYTNSGAGTLLNMRMTILGTYNATGGLIGIGDMGTGAAPFAPQQLLHQHYNENANNFHQFTNLNTGVTIDDGLRVGLLYVPASGTNPAATWADISYLEAQPMVFSTYSTGASPALRERFRMHEGIGFGYPNLTPVTTKVSISRGTTNPPLDNGVAMFNIGIRVPTFATGWGGNRAWMDVGTYYNHETDNMYTGLKEEGLTDVLDAVVNWGDNLPGSNTGENIQNLRFIFTSIGSTSDLYSNCPSCTFNGLEVARMTSNGNVGIGDFYNNGPATTVINPVARLELLDQKLLSYNYPNTTADKPHLRLTFTQAAATTPSTTGIWTDFQTTEKGDLYIHPYGITSPTNLAPINRRVGINTDTPGSTLEINSNVTAAYPGLSGLQFHDLTTASLINTSAFTGAVKGVLSVDVDGKVILVADENGTPSNAIIACSTPGIATPNYLTKVSGTKEICQSGIYETAAQNVGIGTSSPGSKLHVNTSITTGNYASGATIDFASTSSSLINGYGMVVNATVSNASSYNSGINSIVNGGSKCYGVIADVSNTITSGAINVGAQISADGNGNSTNNAIVAYAVPTTTGSSTINRGVDIHVGHNTITATTNNAIEIYTQNAGNNTGINMQVMPTGASSTTNNIGIRCEVGASSSNTSTDTKGLYIYARGGSGINYGVEAAAGTVPTKLAAANIAGKFVAIGGSSFTYGVYATASGSCTGSTSALCPQAAGFFAGDVAVNGSFYPSDIHLKTNIQNFSNGLSIINQLQPKTYNYDTAQYSFMNLHGDLQYGLVAQDLIPVLPQCLKNLGLPQESDSTGKIIHPEVNYLGVNYTMIIPILIAGMKEQQLQIDSLINAIAAGNQPKIANPNTIEVTLSNQSKIILNQNDPNPFAENTTINYFIPDNVNDAQLLFYDNSGTILKTVDIKEKGQGSILIYGSNLSSGVYTYTLLADGKPLETKRMVKIK
jgi:hypothetical protein